MSNPHDDQFRAFWTKINESIKDPLIYSQQNYNVLRQAALAHYGLADNPPGQFVITQPMFNAVFFELKEAGKLQFATVTPKKEKPKDILTTDGRPLKSFQRSAYETADDRLKDSIRKGEEAFTVAKSLQAAKAAKAEQVRREAECTQTILYEKGPRAGSTDWPRTMEARKKATEFWKNVDKQCGITTADE